jgi:hypothetical protein
VIAFVDAASAQDSQAEIVLWTNAPADPRGADERVRSTAALTALTEALRGSRLFDDSRPGPFPQAVWLATDDLDSSDVGPEI